MRLKSHRVFIVILETVNKLALESSRKFKNHWFKKKKGGGNRSHSEKGQKWMRTCPFGPHGTDMSLGPPASLTYFSPWHLEEGRNYILGVSLPSLGCKFHKAWVFYLLLSVFNHQCYLQCLADLNEWANPWQVSLEQHGGQVCPPPSLIRTKPLRINGPRQFKPMLFSSQLYMGKATFQHLSGRHNT